MANRACGAPHVFAGDIARLFRYIGRPELPLEHGVGREVLESREATVPVDLWYDLIELATLASGDSFLGLHFGDHSHLTFREDAGAFRLLLLSSDTVRVAVDRTLRYKSYWNRAESYSIEESDGLVTMRYETWGPRRPAHEQSAEKAAAHSLRFIRAAVKGSVPLAVRFPHAPRPGSEELARVLRCEPEFGHSSSEIVFDAAVLDVRLATADAVLFSVLDHQLAERVRGATAASATSDRARKAISDYLHRDDLSIDVLAKVLKTSERTLQRRLTDEGTSFRDLVDEVRRSRALTMIEGGASVGELAVLLGYGDETAFYRAFRRWTGATPDTWRSRRPAPRTGADRSGADA